MVRATSGPLPLRRHPALAEMAAAWFSEKWGLPQQSYRESIRACRAAGVPQWYVVPDGKGGIAAGAGLIENDFHNRKDLSPNLCALFVEAPCRCQGVAGMLLDFIRKDLGKLGIPVLYLVTGHTGFYEKYGWRFVTMAMGDDQQPLRLYQSPAFSPSPPSALR